MDFVSRHAASPPEPSPAVSSPPPAAASAAPAVAEEPEYLARYLVIKHSWRGRYKRILCISNAAIITLDPGTLTVTNSYDVSSDFEGAVPVIGRGGGGDESTGVAEFTVSLRTDGRGKFKGIKFSSRFRASILTELHRVRWGRLRPATEFPVLHLRRRTSEWVPYKLKVTAVGVELLEGQSGDLRWCLDFRDMDSPAIVLLADNYGKRSTEGGGFILCPLYGRKSKAFLAASGTSNMSIISHLIKTARSTAGVALSADSSQSLTISDFIKKRGSDKWWL